VSPDDWVCGIIVAATSLLTFAIARRAPPDPPGTLLRLRIVPPAILAAIVVVLFPVRLPVWMIAEQPLRGALLPIAAIMALARVSGRSDGSR
jgi:hypothetical protein